MITRLEPYAGVKNIVRTRGGQLDVRFVLRGKDPLALHGRLCRVMHAIPDRLAHLLVTDELLDRRQRLRVGHTDTVVANLQCRIRTYKKCLVQKTWR